MRALVAILSIAFSSVLLAGCTNAGKARTNSTVSPSTSQNPSNQGSGGPQQANPNSATPNSSHPRRSPIVVKRSGGFAGVSDQLNISADGRWSIVGRGAPRTGRLTDAQQNEIARRISDPALAAEARQPRATTNCADDFAYRLQTEQLTMAASECAFGQTPRFGGAIRAIIAATGF